MSRGTYSNGAVLLQNDVILEEMEIDIYKELHNEIEKLVRNIDGLGKREIPDGTNEQIKEKGLEVLKANYAAAYDKQLKRIGKLANDYIKQYCFNLIFFKDAADTMLVDPIEIIKGYIKERTPSLKKAIYSDYSMDEFTAIVNEIHDNITSLAMVNWEKHRELNKK